MAGQDTDKQPDSERAITIIPTKEDRVRVADLSGETVTAPVVARHADSSAVSAGSLTDRLASLGYWPARARKLVEQGKYALAVELCREHLSESPDLLSGRVTYATALHLAGQTEMAAEQFFSVLSRDPDNLVALKYLGDIKFALGDEVTAMTYYRRVQTLDPLGRGLSCPIRTARVEQTRTITLRRPTESAPPPGPLRSIPFYTETLADLYFAQGYPRLAAEIYRVLNERNHTSRLAEKLEQAEQSIRQKER